MTGGLLLTAAALVLWPGPRSAARMPAPAQAQVLPVGGRVAGGPVALAAVLAAGVGAALSTPLVAALAAAVAAAGVRAWARRRAAAEVDDRLRGLADGLGALAADLRSGRSLASAAAAAEHACGNRSAGRSLVLAVRTPEVAPAEGAGEIGEAVARIAAATRLSARTGCSLAAVATAVEDDLRARARHRVELRAATAGPRASAVVLAGLPVLGLLMGSGVGADPWRILTTTGAGQALLVGGVALEAAGLAWSQRLVERALR